MLRKHVMAAWRPYGNKLSKGSEKWGRPKRRCQGQEQPVSSWRCQHQAAAMKALHWVIWSLIFLVFGVQLVCGGGGKSGTAGYRKRSLSNSPSRLPMEEDASLGDCERKWDVRAFCKEAKEKRNSQGEDPRTFKEPVEWWQVHKNRKKKKWRKKKKERKKKVKYRRRSWWKKCKGRIVQALSKERGKKKKNTKAERGTNAPERDKFWGSLEDRSFSW